MLCNEIHNDITDIMAKSYLAFSRLTLDLKVILESYDEKNQVFLLTQNCIS